MESGVTDLLIASSSILNTRDILGRGDGRIAPNETDDSPIQHQHIWGDPALTLNPLTRQNLLLSSIWTVINGDELVLRSLEGPIADISTFTL
jgi:hypothetical protein